MLVRTALRLIFGSQHERDLKNLLPL
ncbi:hypothetical protein SOJ03_01945, partial [Treponema pallidum subsp. pallidum]